MAALGPTTGISSAKKTLAPRRAASEWLQTREKVITVTSSSISVGIRGLPSREFVDCADRHDVSTFNSEWGDDLPKYPFVLTGCCRGWKSFCSPGVSWGLLDLTARIKHDTVFSLDGGPSFARLSMSDCRIEMSEYLRYSSSSSDNDDAPLYIFDHRILQKDSVFLDGTALKDEYSTPFPFSHDILACCTGSRFRPLPPAWLLVGSKTSGTPIHDHPLTVAWNALLTGCKLWAVLPPDIDEDFLQLQLGPDDVDPCCGDGEEENAFDLSAFDWFLNSGELPASAKIIVQRPGEVVFVPAGWWHVVLNAETSVALSHNLTLRRDIDTVFPELVESDPDFARYWLDGNADSESPCAEIERLRALCPSAP